MRNMRRYMHTLERLAWVVETERQQLGWSQNELAVRARTSETVVENIERGEAEDVETVRRVLHALGVEILVLPGELAAAR
ncbi:MAG: helix-turn-helix domain-containing protein [Bifidobacteriaceae bacterium]|jgi:ribosome-binding protein aMBF1 (putative translation factor)|nr:helix-turn-helix domain-containing protein [Bifidobacteriaceae bacterium]